MSRINNNEPENELSSLLNDLSFSYMTIDASKQSLEDLDESIKELSSLVDFLEDQTTEEK